MFTPARQFIHAAAPAARPERPLDQIILPAARQRWMFQTVQSYTPDTIETTLRGALSGDLQATWRLYDLMESTWPRLSKNLKELKDAVASADWIVQPWTQRGKPPTPEATRRAELLDAAIWSMTARPTRDETTFRGLLFDLLDAWGKGISVVELLWEQRTLRTFGSVITPRAATHVWPLYYGYPADRNELMLNVAAVLVDNPAASPAPAQWAEFTTNKFVVGIAKQKSGHPAGSSLLRTLAWWWCAANFSSTWFLNFAQIFGIPIRWAQYDTSQPGLLDQVCDMLENMGSAGWGAFPSGTTLELKEPSKGSSGSLPQEAVIDRADRNCDILILGQTLTTDVGDSGSRALGDVHQDVLGGRKRAAADWLAEVLTGQLAPAFCRLNWGNDDDCPQFVVGSEAAEDPLVMAQRDEILLRSGVRLPQEWFYTRHDIPIPGAGEAVVEQSRQPDLASMLQFGAQPAKTPQDEPDEEEGSNTRTDARSPRCSQMQPVPGHPGVITHLHAAEALGVPATWLKPVASLLDQLIAKAQDGMVADHELAGFLQYAVRRVPELFGQMKTDDLAQVLEAAMADAVIDGVRAGIRKKENRES